MDDMISVIVPVYNVERYLPRCIESILKQTYQNIELILVDDGSPDRSGAICDYYAQKDKRIRVIHKENGGVSSARNAGLDVAKGKFINFVDGDDWIPNDSLEKLYYAMQKSDAQLLVGCYDQREGHVYKHQIDNQVINVKNASQKDKEIFLHSSKYLEMPVLKLFLNSILTEHHIRFDTTVKLGEDSCFCFSYLLHCDKICIISDIVYHYNKLVPNSATHKKYDFSDRMKWRLLTLNKYSLLIGKFNFSNEEKNTLVSYRAYNDVLGLAIIAIREKKETLIESIIKTFYDFIMLDDKWLSVAPFDKLKDIVLYNNYENISDKFKENVNEKTSFIKKIKSKIKKFSIPFIEKKRDGLINYRKILKRVK